MNVNEEAVLFQEAIDELGSASPISLTLDPVVAFSIIGTIQLALRHPANAGVSSDIAREVCEAMIARFPPRLQELARRGFDPRYDC